MLLEYVVHITFVINRFLKCSRKQTFLSHIFFFDTCHGKFSLPSRNSKTNAKNWLISLFKPYLLCVLTNEMRDVANLSAIAEVFALGIPCTLPCLPSAVAPTEDSW